MKLKTRQLRAALSLGVILMAPALGCSTAPARTTPRTVVSEPAVPQRSSAWAGVLPTDAVHDEPLAMAEYHDEYARNDASLGVAQGPAGEVLTYYATPARPSLEWQYRFNLSTSPNSVVVFRRGEYGGYRRGDYGGYRRYESYHPRAYSGYRRGY